MTGARALQCLDILNEGEAAVFDTEDPEEIGAEIRDHSELGGRVNDHLMGEGSRLAGGVDGSLGEGKRGRVLDHSGAADAEGVDTVTTTASRTR